MKIYQRIKDSIKVLIGRSKISPKPIQLYDCNVCGSKNIEINQLSYWAFRILQKHQFIHPFFQLETINFENYECDNCKATDRDRLFALYLDEIKKNTNSILDIAPSRPLIPFLKNKYDHYTSADLYRSDVDDNIDICDMNIYQEGQFDFLTCSHVLEHVEEDVQAISELYRVLKPGGQGLILVPILLNLEEDYENKEIKTPEEKWKHFGQDDHVRFYSKNGFVKKLEVAGFTIDQLNENYFGKASFFRYAIYSSSVLYVVNKPLKLT